MKRWDATTPFLAFTGALTFLGFALAATVAPGAINMAIGAGIVFVMILVVRWGTRK